LEKQLYFDFFSREEISETLVKLQPIIDMLGYTVEFSDRSECDIHNKIISISYNDSIPDDIPHEVGHAIFGYGCCEEHDQIAAHVTCKVLCLLFDIPYSYYNDRALTDWLLDEERERHVCWREKSSRSWSKWTPESCRVSKKVVAVLKEMVR